MTITDYEWCTTCMNAIIFNWTLFWSRSRSMFTFLPHKFPNSPAERIICITFAAASWSANYYGCKWYVSSFCTHFFCPSLCAQWGKQSPAPPHLAYFVRASMLLGCIKHDPDISRDQHHQCTQAEHRWLHSSMSLAWRQVPAPRIVKLLWQWGNFRELCDSKLRSWMMLDASPAMWNWVSVLITLCLNLV